MLAYNAKPEAQHFDQMSNVKNQLIGYSYDIAGNLLNDGLGHVFTYDAENRIATAAGVTYTYDGDGERVKKSTGTLYWSGMGSDPLLETDSAGNTPTEYVFFNGKRVARRDSDNSVHYYFSDHLGSADVITSAAGAIEQESDYYPFGGERVVTGGPNKYKFTGKERDSETLCDYFIARHYCGSMGRFLQADEFPGGPVNAFSPNDPYPSGPLPYADINNPQSLNKYNYTYNNPLRFTDPNGHDAWDLIEGVGDAMGSNAAGGIGREERDNTDFKWGQKIGDAISVVGGGVEMLSGAVLAGEGAVACSSGAGCLVGAPAIAVGGTIAVHGAVEAGTGLRNLLNTPAESRSTSNYDRTPENNERMQQGKPPIGNDGHPVERHHVGQTNNGPVKDMTRTEHRLGKNFQKNHPNTGQKTSQINRSEANKARRKHWKNKAKEENNN